MTVTDRDLFGEDRDLVTKLVDLRREINHRGTIAWWTRWSFPGAIVLLVLSSMLIVSGGADALTVGVVLSTAILFLLGLITTTARGRKLLERIFDVRLDYDLDAQYNALLKQRNALQQSRDFRRHVYANTATYLLRDYDRRASWLTRSVTAIQVAAIFSASLAAVIGSSEQFAAQVLASVSAALITLALALKLSERGIVYRRGAIAMDTELSAYETATGRYAALDDADRLSFLITEIERIKRDVEASSVGIIETTKPVPGSG